MGTFVSTRLASLTACLVACADGQPVPEGPPAYLALGDSVAFGFDPLVDMKQGATSYPQLVADRHALELTNASCPGEASGGFISPTGNDNHCRENRLAYPLRVSYEGTQLAFAYDFLASHANTKLVTIDIGANDVSKLNDECKADAVCVLGGFVPLMLEYEHNLDIIFSELREVYDGPLVAMAIYNPYPTDPLAGYGLERLNALLAEHVAKYDGVFADAMAAFKAASSDPCKDGLLIAMPDGTCDIHPSAAGNAVLADSIDAVMR